MPQARTKNERGSVDILPDLLVWLSPHSDCPGSTLNTVFHSTVRQEPQQGSSVRPTTSTLHCPGCTKNHNTKRIKICFVK